MREGAHSEDGNNTRSGGEVLVDHPIARARPPQEDPALSMITELSNHGQHAY